MAEIDLNPGSLTDYQAKSIVIKSLRTARQFYRRADTIGEKYERELDRMIKRKTRINAGSFKTLVKLHNQYNAAVDQLQRPLADAMNAASQF